MGPRCALLAVVATAYAVFEANYLNTVAALSLVRSLRKRSLPELECYDKCVRAMQDQLETSTQLNGVDLIYDRTAFQKFCGAFNETKTCMDTECIDSQLVRMGILGADSPVRYICIDNYQSFLDNMACYQAANLLVKELCDPKCGNFDKLEGALELALISNDQSWVAKSLADLCNHLGCTLDCQSPIVSSKCNSNKAAAFFEKLVMKTFKQLERFAGQIDRGGYIEICERVLKPREIVTQPKEEFITKPQSLQNEQPKIEPTAKSKSAITADEMQENDLDAHFGNASGGCSGTDLSLGFVIMVLVFSFLSPRF